MKPICRSSRLLIFACAVILCACHTTRHTVSEVDVAQNLESAHHEQAITNRLDSLISKLSVSADSITIDLYDSAPQTLPQADSLGAKEERHGSNVLSQTNVADSTRSNSQSHTSTNDSKEVIGGAEPPDLTAVFIVLGLGITLLLIGAVFGYLWLHKKHII